MLKVGFSASRCIYDIVEGLVSLDEVVSITTGTSCETKEHWMEAINAYVKIADIFDTRSLNGCDYEKVIETANALWDAGKIHQPRLVGGGRYRPNFVWMDLQHTKEDRDNNPALRKAWEQAQVLEALSTTPNPDEPLWHPV